MKKTFNITGTCHPAQHYMMDNKQKIAQVLAMIEAGAYFTINRPRQYGKTTTLHFIEQHLLNTKDYLPIVLNFQGIDRKWHEHDTAFAQMFVQEVYHFLEFENKPISKYVAEQKESVQDMGTLSVFISRLVEQFGKKLVLMIDEVDASSNYLAFLNFLGMLRSKYLVRNKRATFHSIVLAGVHDIKSLKFKLRQPEEAQYNSPWNIATDFTVDLSFNPTEIVPMLEEYALAEEKTMDVTAIAERLYYHTSGYPFLVSKLCKNIAEIILPEKMETNCWTLDDVETSVQYLLKENNTNFDSLINNLENHKDLYDLVSQIILQGEVVPFNQYNPQIYKGILYGIFKSNGQIRIHNRIYEQLIYDYMASKLLTSFQEIRLNYSGFFMNEDGSLDMPRVLLTFQSFMKEQRSQRDLRFVEREWRLIFLSFLKPILNGKGHDFKEVETSEEKRLDVVVTYLQFKYILELKIWRGEKAHQKGLNQLTNYLQAHSAHKGFLLIFDTRKEIKHEAMTITHLDKEIFTVWV